MKSFDSSAVLIPKADKPSRVGNWLIIKEILELN